MLPDKIKRLNPAQRKNLITLVQNVVADLPPEAIFEFLGGYDRDIDKLLDALIDSTYRVLNFGGCVHTEDFDYLDKFYDAVHYTLLKHNYNYFKSNVLDNFQQNVRNLEWGSLIELYTRVALLAQRGSGKSFEACYAYPLWRLYSFDKPKHINKYDQDNNLRRETCMITNESKLGRTHVEKIISEIKANPILKEKLNHNNKGNLGVDGITTTSGSKLHLRSYGSFVRGLHVGACICDDYVDESSMYSKEQRSKFREQFYGAIGNIIVQNGRWLVSGTPFHEQDLYNDLKEDPTFAVFEFPGIYPDGRLLAPDIYTFDYLMDKQKAEGSLVFAREHLVSPISDASSIFPYEILNNALIGMENYKLESFAEKYPLKFKRIVMGCDFAISGSVGADYTVYTVWGVTEHGVYYLIDFWRKKGATHNEQLSMMANMDERHKPNRIICESNNFQIILSDMAKQMGLHNVEPFNTNSFNKKDLKSGLPSLAALFERHEIKLPYGDQRSKDTAHWLMSEFNSMTFNQDKGTLESITEHDDGPMSCFMAINNLREQGTGYKAYMV